MPLLALWVFILLVPLRDLLNKVYLHLDTPYSVALRMNA